MLSCDWLRAGILSCDWLRAGILSCDWLQAADAVLLLQPDRAVPPHLQHGRARLHPAAGLGGEAIARWVKPDV